MSAPPDGNRFVQVAVCEAEWDPDVREAMVVALDNMGAVWMHVDSEQRWRPLPHHPGCDCKDCMLAEEGAEG